MLWNTVLAFVPFGLAIMLFRSGAFGPGHTCTPLWWITFAIWVAFLPNAPYVITDVVHLVQDLQRASPERDPYALLDRLWRVLRVWPRALRLVDVAL